MPLLGKLGGVKDWEFSVDISCVTDRRDEYRGDTCQSGATLGETRKFYSSFYNLKILSSLMVKPPAVLWQLREAILVENSAKSVNAEMPTPS